MNHKITTVTISVTLLVIIASIATVHSFNPPKPRSPHTSGYEPIEPTTLKPGEPINLLPLSNRLSPRSLHPSTYRPVEETILKPIESPNRRRWALLELQARYSSGGDISRSNPDRLNHPRYITTTCWVTTPADSGAGSLRQCLLNVAQGATIDFDPQAFPPTAPVTITLLSPLPWITTDTLTIDGSNAGVILDGSKLSTGVGLAIDDADGVTIRGLQIVNFPWEGVALVRGASNAIIGGDRSTGTAPLGQGNLISRNLNGVYLGAGTTGNQVLGNYIGANLAGNSAPGNSKTGIIVTAGASDNVIGGNTPGTRNLISGNGYGGIFLQKQGTDRNIVAGNYIGTDASGTVALGNSGAGIVILGGAKDNVVGGDTAGTRNLISGNIGDGIVIQDDGTTGNQVMGNYIGTDATGSQSLGNDWAGVVIIQDANHNIVGGFVPGSGNLISGNGEDGIVILGNGTANNQVMGNFIGTDSAGTTPLGNGRIGILLFGGAKDNVVGGSTPGTRNVISGNNGPGIKVQDDGTTGNQILGNYIGADAAGTVRLGNVEGVVILAGAKSNTVGGNTARARNVISGNTDRGIVIQDSNTTGNQVMGNYIGTDSAGSQPLGNDFGGVVMIQGANHNIVGGDVPGAGNLISGNGEAGVLLADAGTSENRVLGNYIGTDASGTLALGNIRVAGVAILTGAGNNVIGGGTEGARNIISGNTGYGIQIQHVGTTDNQILGNYIGTDATGTQSLGNDLTGVIIELGASHNIVGGAGLGAGNLISGNEEAGIAIADEGTSENQVLGNHIGTDASGQMAIPNMLVGVGILLGATDNVIGGVTPGAGNLISGNYRGVEIAMAGTDRNQILGNYIGTDVTGRGALGNSAGGIVIALGAADNMVGGTTAGARNVISGNIGPGIQVQNDGSAGNQIMGNYIGTDATGTSAVENSVIGIAIADGAKDNIVGGDTAGARNVISGNTGPGIQIQNDGSTGNQITGNYIGTDATGRQPLGNELAGVALIQGASHNIVGGNVSEAGNLISGNGESGVWLEGSGTVANQVASNYVGTDASGSGPIPNTRQGIYLRGGANSNVIGPNNTVAYNTLAGVTIEGESATGNTITRNRIHQNGGPPIDWTDTSIPTGPLSPPTLISYSSSNNVLSGNTCGNCQVEVFASSGPEPSGAMFLDAAIADINGDFTLTLTCPPPLPYLSATTTGLDGTTSEFSAGPDPVPVACLDFSGDCQVTAVDVGMVASAWRTPNSSYDLDNNGTVTVADIVQVAAEWGLCP